MNFRLTAIIFILFAASLSSKAADIENSEIADNYLETKCGGYSKIYISYLAKLEKLKVATMKAGDLESSNRLAQEIKVVSERIEKLDQLKLKHPDVFETALNARD
tara:strand:+ start:801 stop:1115 length:315 start_codon:yes stop_codon:yes gene_type:complete